MEELTKMCFDLGMLLIINLAITVTVCIQLIKNEFNIEKLDTKLDTIREENKILRDKVNKIDTNIWKNTLNL